MRQNYDSSQWRYSSVVPATSYAALADNIAACVEMVPRFQSLSPGPSLLTGQEIGVSVIVHNAADNEVIPFWYWYFHQHFSHVSYYLEAEGQPGTRWPLNCPSRTFGFKVGPGQDSSPVTVWSHVPQVASGTYRLMAEVVPLKDAADRDYEMYLPNNRASLLVTVAQGQPTNPLTCEPEPDNEPPPDGGTTTVVSTSYDPNEKTGPPGAGPLRVVRISDELRYTIYFENVITATAPAQEVIVTDYLDLNLDWSTLNFTEVAFGDEIVAATGDQFNTRQVISDYRAGTSKSWWVDVTAQLNRQTGRVTWSFRTLDPATEGLPDDPLAGFLPPNDASGRGEGHVSFAIRPKASVPLGTTIRNRASIVFDTNDPIGTNEVWNTIGIPETILGKTYLPLIRK